MTVYNALIWLCEEPRHSFTFNLYFRRGWPGLANFFLLPKPFTLGRAVRFIERTIFIGAMAGFVILRRTSDSIAGNHGRVCV